MLKPNVRRHSMKFPKVSDNKKDTDMSESRAYSSIGISSPFKMAAKISNSDLPIFDDMVKLQLESPNPPAKQLPSQFYQTRQESRGSVNRKDARKQSR